MSRSAWKPLFLHPQVIEKLAAKEIVVQNRASLITQSIIGFNFKIYNGIRWFPLKVTQDSVGQSLGQFAPTRKRPIVKKAKIIKKK